MTKIDIISGFLGAGKTTLIKKLLKEGFKGEKIVIIENEFGEIGIDGGLLKETGIEIKEMNSGCICCTIVGDFSAALKDVLKTYQPDRVIIEPSGVGKLSDVQKACQKFIVKGEIELNMCIAVVDTIKFKMYLRNFSEFFSDQIQTAKTIVLSRTQKVDAKKLDEVIEGIKNINASANIITTNWDEITGDNICFAAENDRKKSFEIEVLKQLQNTHSCCGHSHGEGHEEAHKCSCNHEQEHGHSADEIFQVWGVETPKIFSTEKIEHILEILDEDKTYGNILRAKGIVSIGDNDWIQFDYVPQEIELKSIAADYTGRLCVIGENINAEKLKELFEV